jgi:aminoglycoside N3'-acetyltransferase
MVTRQEIAADLRGLGIGTGDLVAVHSSLKSIGRVEGGAPTVVEAFLDVLGPTGNLLVPTFSFTFATWEPGALFEPSKTPSKVGAVTEAARKHPRCRRSLHPTHSVGVIGPLADELTRDHLASSPIGPGSPFDRFRERNGTVLMIGCDLDSCSILHLYEVLAGLPYIDIAFREGYAHELANIGRNGKKVVGLQLYEIPGCSVGFVNAEPVLEKSGVLRHGRIRNARSLLFRSRDAGEVLIAELRRRPDLLLCTRTECSICPRRRAVVRARSSGRG